MLQVHVSEETSERRRSKCKTWKKEMKEFVDECKMRIDEKFGRK